MVQISTLITLIRQRLDEPTPRYWSNQELNDIVLAGIRDMWRSVVDLKQEYYLTIDETNVSLPANSTQLQGVPDNVYKVYLIEALNHADIERGVSFTPKEYNHRLTIQSRAVNPTDPNAINFLYSIIGEGSSAGPTTITVAPQSTSPVPVRFVYIPNLPDLTENDFVPIPGEATNALVAWGVAYARAKERADRSPDPTWLTLYGTEKANILEGLGLRQLQEPQFVDAMFGEYWGE